MTTDFLPAVGAVLEELIPTDATRETAPKFVTSAIKSSIVIYYLPKDATETHYKIAMAAMTLCGRCEDERPASWQSWVLTWSVLCFPELLDKFKNDGSAVDYSYQPFPENFLDSATSAIRAHAADDAPSETFVVFPPSLPAASTVPMTSELVYAAEIEGLYAYYSMLIFIMGKSIGSDNLASVSSQRPLALIRKRMLQKCEYLLIGEGKPTTANYRHIQSGWVRSTRHRITVVKHLAMLNAADNRSESLDTVCVNMDMLRNSGQTYMFYIHELFTACPWCIEIPAIRAAYYHYVRIVKVLAAQPAWFQPYYKLAYQDSTKVVRRKDIEALISVAAFYAAQTRKTMSQYRVNMDTLPVVTAFQKLALSKGFVFENVENQQTTEVSTV
jgi:hypothetical protein